MGCQEAVDAMATPEKKFNHENNEYVPLTLSACEYILKNTSTYIHTLSAITRETLIL